MKDKEFTTGDTINLDDNIELTRLGDKLNGSSQILDTLIEKFGEIRREFWKAVIDVFPEAEEYNIKYDHLRNELLIGEKKE